MFSHLPELLIVLVIGLIVFGPERLPEMAHNAGKMMRDVRDALDTAMNPQDTTMPDDFETYYYEAMARSGETAEGDPEQAENWVTPEVEGEWEADVAGREASGEPHGPEVPVPPEDEHLERSAEDTARPPTA